MYTHTSAFQNLLPGEPAPEALHREDYFEHREEHAEKPATVTHPALLQRAALLRAQVTVGVGKFFA
jgi:hypothetical protein